jgi:RHS repeat-associated protein
MKKYYYIKDHLGSIRSVINESGTVVESYDYYPFGLKMPNRTFVSGTGSKNLFTGKERDNETGWDYFGARYYYPAIGRWLSVDPMFATFPDQSSYQYTHNNPINRYDPDGKADFGSAEKLNEVATKIMNDVKYLKRATIYNVSYNDYSGEQKLYYDTFCNFGVRDILLEGDDHSVVNMTANTMYDFLSLGTNGPNSRGFCATEISWDDAVRYAKEGITVILAAKGKNHGHVVIVAPEDLKESKVWGKKVPTAYNIGLENKKKTIDEIWGVGSKDKVKAFILNKDKNKQDEEDDRAYGGYLWINFENLR